MEVGIKVSVARDTLNATSCTRSRPCPTPRRTTDGRTYGIVRQYSDHGIGGSAHMDPFFLGCHPYPWIPKYSTSEGDLVISF
jgi:hypothetical protein